MIVMVVIVNIRIGWWDGVCVGVFVMIGFGLWGFIGLVIKIILGGWCGLLWL